jgi:hypothetical protein
MVLSARTSCIILAVAASVGSTASQIITGASNFSQNVTGDVRTQLCVSKTTLPCLRHTCLACARCRACCQKDVAVSMYAYDFKVMECTASARHPCCQTSEVKRSFHTPTLACCALQGTSYGFGSGGGHRSFQISGAARQPWITGINYYVGGCCIIEVRHSLLHMCTLMCSRNWLLQP